MDTSSDSLEPVELLIDEFMERQRRGEQPTVEEFAQRYPDLADEIREVLPALVVIEQVAPVSADLAQSQGTVESPEQIPLQKIGDYRILKIIGRGGMGVVYEAEQESLRRRVALKVLPRQFAADAKSLERFRREARAAARMHHTNIVPVFEVGQDDETVFYAMQLIQGQGLDLVIDDIRELRSEHSILRVDLPAKAERPASERSADYSIAASLMTGHFEQDNLALHTNEDANLVLPEVAILTDRKKISGYVETVIQQSGSTISAVLPGQSEITTAETNRSSYYLSVAHIGLQTSQALAYAHTRGIIHRDIKPSNLLLDAAGVVWVTDFGLAKSGDEAMTHTGDILGTLRYMSPERFRGQCDVRADVYSLGLTLYEMLVLKPAFQSSDRLKLINMVSKENPPTPRSLDPRIPRDLETIVLKSIDKDPKRRYQSADELSEDLQRFVDDEPIRARRISLIERLTRWSRRNKALSSMTAAIALLLVTFSVFSFVAARNFKRLAEDETAAREKETEALRRETDAHKQAAIAAAAAVAARKTSDQKRSEAVAARNEAVAAGYVADMNFARTLWEAGNIKQLKELLVRHIPLPGDEQTDLRNFEWYFWWRATHLAAAEIDVTTGASSGRIAVSPDHKFVCVVHWANRAAILNRKTRERIVPHLKLPRGFSESRQTPCFSSDGLTLYVAGIDGTVARFDTTTWQRGPDLATDLGKITAIAVSPQRPQMAIATENQIRILDTKTGKTLDTFNYKGTFYDMAFAPDGDTLTVGLHKRMVRVTGFLDHSAKPLWRQVPQIPAWKDLPVHLSAVAGLAYSRDGKRLVTCGYEGVRLWNPQTFEPIQLLRSPSAVTSVAFSPKGSRVAGGTSENNAILVWQTDLPNQRPIVIHGHSKKVLDVVFPESEDELWSSGDGGKVMVWDLKKCRPYDAELIESAPRKTVVVFHPDGRQLLVGIRGHVDSYDVADISQKKLLNRVTIGTVNGNWTVDWSATDKKLRVWDGIKGKLVREWPVDFIEGGKLAISRDGSTVAWARSGRKDGVARLTILPLPGGQPRTVEFLPDRGVVSEVTLSPDGKRCAVRGGWATNFWDLSGPKPASVRTLENFGPDYCTAFSPDGKLLAVGSWNNNVRLHDAQTGKLLRALQGHSSPVACLAFSADGKTLISGSWGGAIKLWDPNRGELRTTLRGHVGRVTTLAMSPDGRSIASYGADRWLRVWRAATAADSKAALVKFGETSYGRAVGRLRALSYREALDDFRRAAALLPTGSYKRDDAAFRIAFLLVHFGKIDEYLQFCRRFVVEHENTDDIQIMERTLKLCLFADVIQHEDVLPILSRFAKSVAANFERVAKEKPEIRYIRHWILQALGIAAYRAGNYAEAGDWLRKSNAAFAKSKNPDTRGTQTATNLYYLALAAQRAGQTEEARKRFAEANAEFGRRSGTAQTNAWTDWIILQSVRREAERLIKEQ